MEQDLRNKDREQGKVRADAILEALPLHPLTGAVWDRAEVAAVVRVKGKAEDRAAAEEGNNNLIKA